VPSKDQRTAERAVKHLTRRSLLVRHSLKSALTQLYVPHGKQRTQRAMWHPKEVTSPFNDAVGNPIICSSICVRPTVTLRITVAARAS